jgi:hypothetical protein
MSKPNGYKKFIQKKVNKAIRKDGRQALRRGVEPQLTNRRRVTWLAT